MNKFKIKNLKFKTGGGFTLTELIVAIALFTVIAFLSIGAVLSIFDANRWSRSSKTVVDNLNIALESMTRTVRFGEDYQCGSGGALFPGNCSEGGDTLKVNFDGDTIIYRLCGASIYKSETGNTGCAGAGTSSITSPDTVIDHLKFYVFGTSNGDTTQPYVVAVIRGHVGPRPTSQSIFNVQTMMSQRSLDFLLP